MLYAIMMRSVFNTAFAIFYPCVMPTRGHTKNARCRFFVDKESGTVRKVLGSAHERLTL